MKTILTAVAITALGLTSAFAADLPARTYTKAPPMVAPIYNWTGFYIGGHAGWAASRDRVDGTDGTFDATGPQAYEQKPSGYIAGGQLGYNWQMASWVVGLEADLGYLGLNRALNPVPGIDDAVGVNYGFYYTVTGRVGYAFNNALLYAKGGYVGARISTAAGDLDGGQFDPTDAVDVRKNRSGWTVGGGLEYGLTPNWSVKGEYLYMNFRDLTVQNLDIGPNEFYTFRDEVHTVKFGVNYRFGGPVVAKY